MKKQQTGSFVSLNQKELETLTVEVKETVAKDCCGTEHKLFGTADLWNIHRSKRSMGSRRFFA